MNDRELLELAAKAVGLNIKSYAVDTDDNIIHLIVGRKFTKEKTAWNPLTNDGDALRLAVKLKLNIDHIGESVHASHNTHDSSPDGWSRDEVDRYANTRRAITQAAANILLAKEQS